MCCAGKACCGSSVNGEVEKEEAKETIAMLLAAQGCPPLSGFFKQYDIDQSGYIDSPVEAEQLTVPPPLSSCAFVTWRRPEPGR